MRKWPTTWLCSLYNWKKIVWNIEFTVFKSTRLDLKHWFWKICTESPDIIQKVQKSAIQTKPAKFETFWPVSRCMFLKPNFALKPWTLGSKQFFLEARASHELTMSVSPSEIFSNEVLHGPVWISTVLYSPVYSCIFLYHPVSTCIVLYIPV